MGFLESIRKMIADHPVQTEESHVLEEKKIEEECIEEEHGEEDIVLVVDELELQTQEDVEVVIPELKPHKMSRKDLFEMIWEDVTRVRGD